MYDPPMAPPSHPLALDSPVAVVRKALSVLLSQADHDLVIQAQVEDGVHHAGHGDLAAAAAAAAAAVLEVSAQQ